MHMEVLNWKLQNKVNRYHAEMPPQRNVLHLSTKISYPELNGPLGNRPQYINSYIINFVIYYLYHSFLNNS